MTNLRPQRHILGVAAATAVLILSVGLAAPAGAAWQTTASVPAPAAISAAKLVPPELSCDAQSSPPKLTWTAVPNATSYVVQPSGATTAEETQATSLALTRDLLTRLLVAVFGTTQSFTVVAKKGAWTSDPSNRRTVVVASLLAGGGVTCSQ